MQGFDKFNYFLIEKQLWNNVTKQFNLHVVKIIMKKKTKKKQETKTKTWVQVKKYQTIV